MLDQLKRYFDSLPIAPENRRIINLPNTITMVRLGIIPVLFFAAALSGSNLELT